jgi:hypothetical protein
VSPGFKISGTTLGHAFVLRALVAAATPLVPLLVKVVLTDPDSHRPGQVA